MPFKQSAFIEGSNQQVFEAISRHVREWWGHTDATVDKVGDEFTTSFDQTYWKFRISELNRFDKIVWECIDARHIHTGYDGIEKEWLGTSVEWVLESIETGTLLHFTHDGLEPDLNCYKICKPAWELFVTQSLKSFVETGKGMPSLL